MKRCMIVDDSSVVRKVAKRILASHDVLVVEAASGTEALSLCAGEMPDLIVVDTTLPDMAAADFIREVLSRDAEIKPRVIICIAEVDVGAIMRAKRAGASGYLLKPFNRPQLLERFREFDVAA
ncbi:MAG: response regulator [Rhizobiaceae bacterium]|jgi:two-component system chemotaxis response regulator CheY